MLFVVLDVNFKMCGCNSYDCVDKSFNYIK